MPEGPNKSDERLERLLRLDRIIGHAVIITFIVLLFYPTTALFMNKFDWENEGWLVSILGFPFLLMGPLVFGIILGKIVHSLIRLILFRVILKIDLN